MSTLPTYYRRVGALSLTVEPLSVSDHGEYPNTWVARVDLDVIAYDTTANVARTHFGARSPARARARAINRGHAMLIAAIIQGIGQSR